MTKNNRNGDWNQTISDHRRRVLPWERSQIPSHPSHHDTEYHLKALAQLKRLVRRGRWWYLMMRPVRAVESVWASPLGKGVIILLMFIGYMVNSLLYIQAQQFKADTVSADASFGESDVLFWIWSWGVGAEVDDVIARHDAQIELHYAAKALSWYIPRYRFERTSPEPRWPRTTWLEYMPWSLINVLQGELRSTQKLKPKVDELKRRSMAIGWMISMDPPYLNEAEIDALLTDVESAERLKPIADDLFERASAIKWDLSTRIDRNPYNEEQLERLRTTLVESEGLYPTVVALRANLETLSWYLVIEPPFDSRQVSILETEVEESLRLKDAMDDLHIRAEALNWSVRGDPAWALPYTDEKVSDLQQQVMQSEQLRHEVQQLIQDADALGWSLQTFYKQPPFDEEILRKHQAALKEMQRLKSQVEQLREQYTSIDLYWNMGVPYTESALVDARAYYEEFRISHPIGLDLNRQLRRVDVGGNLMSPFSPDEVEGLRDCLEASQVLKEYGKRGYDCKCQYQWIDEFSEIVCKEYDWNHPKVEEVVTALQREGVKVATRSRYSIDTLTGLEQCLEQAKSKDDLARNCECTFQWDDFKELKCEYAASSECGWIKNDDLKYLCKKDCGWIKDDDLKYLCKKDCGWIKDDDLKYLCKNDCGWIKDDDLKYLCKKDCGWIKNDDLKRACKGKWYLR